MATRYTYHYSNYPKHGVGAALMQKPAADHFDDPSIRTAEEEERAAMSDIARRISWTNGLRAMREAVVAAEWNELGNSLHPADCECSDCDDQELAECRCYAAAHLDREPDATCPACDW